jgi:peroxiredoxin
MTIAPGEAAPLVEGASVVGPHALVFYKVTCPTCQMSAPALNGLERAYPGRVFGVGQDPPDALASFSERFGLSFPSVSDTGSYEASNAYGVEHVPTTVLVDGEGRVADVVESWNRDGINLLSSSLAALLGVEAATISSREDGLPAFRPG